MPPAPQHPPPAPDWILGDDGHWKPPPFDGGSRSGPRPAPPPPPPRGRDGGRRSVSGWLGMRRRDVVWGVLGLAFLGVGLVTQGMDLVELVRGDDEEPALVAEPVVDPEVVDSMEDEERRVLGPGGDPVCPESEWVGRMIDRPVPSEIVREGVERSVNGVDLSGIECRYGDDVRLGKLHDFEHRVDRLAAGGGPVEVREGPFPGSVRFDDPEAGTATIVYEDEDEVLEAFVQLPLDHSSYLISLAELTLN